jgi:hypothetical protein
MGTTVRRRHPVRNKVPRVEHEWRGRRYSYSTTRQWPASGSSRYTPWETTAGRFHVGG